MPAALGIIFAGVVGSVSAAIAGTSIVTGFLINAGLAAAASLLAPKPPSFNANLDGLTGLDPASIDTRGEARAAIEGARWIFGRARTAGSLKFYQEIGDDQAWLAFALSEGECDDIEAVWIDGEEVNFTSSGNTITLGTQKSDTSVNYSGKAVLYKYLKGDGTEGAEIRAACSEFTSNHRFEGVSWYAAHLTQPEYDDADGRFWARRPTIELLVKGAKITWPGQAAATWTENAAAIRHWIEINRGGLDPLMVDRTSFDSAYAVCNAQVSVTSPALPAGYTTTGLRYSVNGILTSDMDFASVRREFDFAWQGWAVEAGGMLYFKPGADRAIVGTVSEGDTAEIMEVRPAPGLQERQNAVSMTLTQSRDTNYEPFDVPETTDNPALTRDDNFYLPQDAGKRVFVNSPITALRLQAIILRRLRPSLTMTMRIFPGDNLERLSWIPGDRLEVTNSEYGMTNFLVEITKIEVDEGDMSLVLTLDEVRAGAYSDDLDLPPIKRRDLQISGPRSIGALRGLTLDEIAIVQSDGTTVVSLVATYTQSGYRAEFELREQGETSIIDTQVGVSGNVRFSGVAVGTTYEVRGRFRSFDGRPGPWSAWANRTIGGDLTPPAAPTFPTDPFTALPGGYRIAWNPPEEDDYSHTLVYQNLTNNVEADAILIGRSSDSEFTRLGFAMARQVRLWLRHVDRSGNQSASANSTGDSGAPGAAAVDPDAITEAVNTAIANNTAFQNLTGAVNDARAARDAAQTAQTAAEQAETNAEAAETATEEFKDDAETAARNAQTSETDAETSATAAAGSARTAGQRATAAGNSATAAAGSATAAQASSTAAGNSARAAATDASAARTSASEAGASATSASASANTATTQAGNARASATRAATSETNADGSARNAASSATSVAASVTAAETAETNAERSATNADGSATRAANSASAASTSARNAEASRNEAGQFASAASGSADTARTQAGNASAAATRSASSASEADGSATAAANSASGIATLATNASDSARAAAASASQARSSASDASTSATSATSEANRAATAATNAEASRDSAAAAVTTAQGSAAAAQTSQQAAATAANSARQAIAGLDARVAVEVGENLEASFASAVTLRAVAGTAQSKLELVALDGPAGPRAAAVVTGDFQSDNFSDGSTAIPAVGASGRGGGFVVESRVRGTRDNGSTLTIRVRNSGRDAITVTGTSAVTVSVESAGAAARTVQISRAAIRNAFNNAGNNLRISNVNPGSISVALPANQDWRTAVTINLSGGVAEQASTGRRGWRLRRDGTAQLTGAEIGLTRQQLEDAGVPFNLSDLDERAYTDLTGRPTIPTALSQLTGFLSAAQIAAININASQITAGTIAAGRIDASNIRSWDEIYSSSSSTGTLVRGTGNTVSFTATLSNYDMIYVLVLGNGECFRVGELAQFRETGLALQILLLRIALPILFAVLVAVEMQGPEYMEAALLGQSGRRTITPIFICAKFGA